MDRAVKPLGPSRRAIRPRPTASAPAAAPSTRPRQRGREVLLQADRGYYYMVVITTWDLVRRAVSQLSG
jgi:hypothetical protein